MNNIMVDLETMNTTSDAAIIAIGAVYFDKNGLGRSFYKVVNLQSSMNAGLTVGADTMMWWLKQSDEARAAIGKPGMSLLSALYAFADWVGTDKNIKVWGNGANFDNPILATAYQRLDQVPPWKFWNDRCYRTMKAMYPGVPLAEFKGTKHNALHDAKFQALHLLDIVKFANIDL